MSIFSFIGHILTELFRKTGNWRQTCRHMSLPFYTSNGFFLKNNLLRRKNIRKKKEEKNIRPVWLNGWVFVYELSDCGFESCCSHVIAMTVKVHTSHQLHTKKMFKGSYQIITVNCLCVRHKKRRRPNQHSKLLFLKISLHFDTSD